MERGVVAQFSTWSSSLSELLPHRRGPYVGVTPVAKSINTGDTFRAWGSDHWVDLQTHCVHSGPDPLGARNLFGRKLVKKKMEEEPRETGGTNRPGCSSDPE